jgi:hypothetical protein
MGGLALYAGGMRFQTIRLFSCAILCAGLGASSLAVFGQATDKSADSADPHYSGESAARNGPRMGAQFIFRPSAMSIRRFSGWICAAAMRLLTI